MKELNCKVTSCADLYAQVKAASTAIKNVFSDAMGFVAVGANGVEVRIGAALAHVSSWRTFHTKGTEAPFEGTLMVPEWSDFGLEDPDAVAAPAAEEAPAEAPAADADAKIIS